MQLVCLFVCLGLGQRGPDFNQSIVLENGITIPTGPVVQYPQDPNDTFHHYYRLQHNEYVSPPVCLLYAPVWW